MHYEVEALDESGPRRGLVGARHPRPADQVRTTRASATASPGKVLTPTAADARAEPRAAGPRHPAERPGARVRHGPPGRGRRQRLGPGERARATRRASSCSRTSRPAGRCGSRKLVAYHYDRDTPPGDLAARAGRTLDRAPLDGLDVHRGRAAPPRRRVLGAQRRADRRCARGSSRRCASTSSAAAGHLPRRGARRAGQGPDRARLRGPLLLGHRDLRRAVPDPHRPAGARARCSTSAAACSTPRAGARARSTTRARCSRGARSTARRRPPTTRPAPPSTTSTPTSPTPCASTTT